MTLSVPAFRARAVPAGGVAAAWAGRRALNLALAGALSALGGGAGAADGTDAVVSTSPASAPSVASASSSSPSGPVTYRFDPDHTFVTFEVRHFATSTLRGRFGPVDGEVLLDRSARRGDLRLRIPLQTLDTGYKPLDARLKAPDLLSVDAFPEAYFLAPHFRFDAAGAVAEVRGEFILRGVSVPLSLHAQRFACRQDARWRREVCGGDFEADLHRSDFGAGYGEPFVGDAVHLLVQVEAVAP